MNKNMIALGAGVAANSVMLISQMAAANPPSQLSQSLVSGEANQVTAAVANEGTLTLEESFLRVPQMCKDRTFSIDPAPVGREAVPENVLSLYSAMDASNA